MIICIFPKGMMVAQFNWERRQLFLTLNKLLSSRAPLLRYYLRIEICTQMLKKFLSSIKTMLNLLFQYTIQLITTINPDSTLRQPSPRLAFCRKCSFGFYWVKRQILTNTQNGCWLRKVIISQKGIGWPIIQTSDGIIISPKKETIETFADKSLIPRQGFDVWGLFCKIWFAIQTILSSFIHTMFQLNVLSTLKPKRNEISNDRSWCTPGGKGQKHWVITKISW